ncbi:MAG: transglutaminase-like domain-containing protein [Victivallaceae bacterium]|nr:transglutaminase-like domain-containing protein [Victivallaceae bacterium]
MNKTVRKQPQKIIDTSRQLREPQRLPFHWAYLIYFGAAITSSLWQHADPILTCTLLLLLFPVGFLAYLPYQYLSSNKRFIGQLVFIAFGAGWCLFRLKTKVPVDKVLVETLCVITFCFIIAQRRNDYDYLLLVSIFLFLYGALLPRRIFLIAFISGGILCALLLYSTRLKSISSQLDLETPAKIVLRNWPQYLLHIILSLLIFNYVFSLIPTQESSGEGLFAASFRTDNDSVLPPAFRKWFSSDEVKKSPRGNLTAKGGSPTAISKAGTPIRMKKDRKLSVPGRGGGGTPGKELIFRVKSPVKLYWVAQIYDIYDGLKWTFTAKFPKNGFKPPGEVNEEVTHYNIDTRFVIEKWLSPKLYFAYRPIGFDLFKDSSRIYQYKMSAFNTVLNEKIYPELPFSYNVTTVLYIPLLDARKRIDCSLNEVWTDSLPSSHYLKLPRSKISRRLKRLVRRLAAQIKDPYRKALVLRNYLRENYKYQQYSRPVPKNRETVDYFLFSLREGHCEYFASALTVMARLAGLPARVVTGFSPGNYNALNKYFEVHAYHAHAWTQIFIPGMGWLTMDAAPPGNIESRTIPFGIGSMRDPFGDEWRVIPPEITPETISYIRNKYYEKLEADRRSGKFNTYEELFLAAAQAQYQAGEKLKDYLKQFRTMKEQGLYNLKTVLAGLKMKFDRISELFKRHLNRLAEKFRKHWYLFTPAVGIVMAALLEIMILKRYFRRKHNLRKCRSFYAAALANYPEYPEVCIRKSYLLVRSLLNLGGFPRPRNAELLEYGRSLRVVDGALRKDVVVVFFLFSKLEYGSSPVSEEEARDALKRLENIRRYIYPLVHENAELTG